ncbi:hypothetical protein [Nitrosopumilus sp.]|uniref:hypothetical protein n=1 Tax=Nitrosopumilus sp. TaxID=2024843 RepID=UPI0034A0983F
MAESSINVYIFLIIVLSFFGYLLFLLRINRLRPRPRLREFRITYSFVYGFFAWILLMTGFLFAYYGVVYMTFTEISMDFFTIPKPDSSLVASENSWLVNSTFAILEGVKKQSLELKHSEGLALSGIGFGMILVSIPMFLDSWRHNRETQKTIIFVRADFEEINNKLVTVIQLLQNTINSINGNGNFINHLIHRTVPPAMAFGTIISGLYFHRWDLYTSNLRDFGLEDPRTLNQLHGFILDFNRKVEPRENHIVEEVMRILNANDPNTFQILRTYLLDELTRNLDDYQNLYNLLHRELNGITWIPNGAWRQL